MESVCRVVITEATTRENLESEIALGPFVRLHTQAPPNVLLILSYVCIFFSQGHKIQAEEETGRKKMKAGKTEGAMLPLECV